MDECYLCNKPSRVKICHKRCKTEKEKRIENGKCIRCNSELAYGEEKECNRCIGLGLPYVGY